MSYIKATDVLPEELVNVIQNYIDGGYIYIPRKECNRKDWGETTQIKREISDRNKHIYEKYNEGVSLTVLSEMYYLSLKSIQRIVLKVKRES